MVLDLLRLLLVFSFHLLQVDKLVCRVLPSASDHFVMLLCLSIDLKHQLISEKEAILHLAFD